MIGLALLAPLTACAKQPVAIATDSLCKSWRHQTVSKDDVLTDKTATQIEGNNGARTKWGCAYGADKAKAS